MKTIILVLGLITAMATTAFSQTKLIALRSHSGKLSEFDASGDGNYGGPAIYISPEQQKRDAFEKALRDSIAKVNADSIRRAQESANAQRAKDSAAAAKHKKTSKKK